MKNRHREKFLSNLTDTVCESLKRFSRGETLTDNELVLIHLYLRELQKEETQSSIQKLNELVGFAKSSFSGLLAGKTAAGIDDYEINVSEDN